MFVLRLHIYKYVADTVYSDSFINHISSEPSDVVFIDNCIFIAESSLRQATLTCLAASISIDSENKEVFKLLSTNIIPSNSHSKKPVKDKCKKQPTDDTDKIKPADEGSSWLVAHCLQRMNSAGRGRPFLNICTTRILQK